ncbi:MAG: glycosyltransferase family 87 protein, partial [Candidatus Limnocylindria bacterium]
VAFLLADAVIVFVAARGDFAIDFTCCYQQAGQRLLNDPSTVYAWTDTYTFRYSPWAAVLFTALAGLSETVAVWLWLALKVAVVAVVAVGLGRRWSGDARWLVTGMVLFFPPIWHDLALGNVSVFTVAVLAVLLARRDGMGSVAFGLLLLLAPKPHLLPIALWLIVGRPNQFVAAFSTLALGFLLGILVFGQELWGSWLLTFLEPLGRTFTANIGFSGLLGPIGVVVGVVAALVIGAAALARRGDIGLGLSLVSGLVLGPYTFIHYLAGLVAVVDPVLRTRPRWLAPYPWLLVVFPLIPVWLLALAWTMWRSPDPTLPAPKTGAPEGAPPGAGPG